MSPSGPPPAPAPGWWRTWRVPVAQLVAIAVLLVSAAAVVDVQRSEIAADLAADNGVGQRVAVTPVKARNAAPLSVEISRLGISSKVVDLHRLPSGALEVPQDPARVGWYVGSSHPGDAGPTVLAGHVDSFRGPGVFYRLRELKRGDRIVVRRADRTAAAFVVQKVIRVPKRSFPTALVYRGDGRPSLRLITCGGTFDRATGHYRDNLVVLATPALSRKAPARRPA